MRVLDCAAGCPFYYCFNIVHNTGHCRETTQPPRVTPTARKSNLGKRTDEFLVLTPSLWTSGKEIVTVLHHNLNLIGKLRNTSLHPLFLKFIVDRKVHSMSDAVHTENR